MTRLSVNINKIAWLRNARGGDVPNLLQMAKDCERFGADGITVHPRPDERHIRYQDVYDLKEVVTTEFNIEGYPNEDFLQLVEAVKPEQCTLVPDPPNVLTSNAGWNTIKNASFLQETIERLQKTGCRVSLFMENDFFFIEKAAELNVERIELYTGPYADNYHRDKKMAVAPFKEAATFANSLNLGINAGHDLNLDNLAYFSAHIPHLLEVSIGHALISDALYFGIENTIHLYKKQLQMSRI